MFEFLGTHFLSLPLLTITMCLLEQTLNARPMIPMTDDAAVLEALMPNQFVIETSGETNFGSRFSQIGGPSENVQSRSIL